MKKNEEFEVEIEDMGANGEGIAHKDGVTIFVPFSVTGETALIHILKVKDNIAWAKVLEVKESSAVRINPKCKYFMKCGGCVLEHVCDEFELNTKRQKIITAFKKIAGYEPQNVEMFNSNQMYGYRNKCAFPVREIDGVSCVCMFKGNTHTPIKIDRCELADESINKIISVFNKFLQVNKIKSYDEESNTGLVKFLVVRVVGGVPLVTIVLNGKKLPNISNFVEDLLKLFNKFGLNINVNTTNNNVILSSQFDHVFGEKELILNEFGISYPVSSLSFLQINDYVKNMIYSKVLEKIKCDDIVIDAYSGAGLLSAIMAQKAKMVYGIEIIPDATINANNLIKNNNITNLKNINGDCAVELPRLVRDLNEQNIKVVLDPPRKGCDKKVVDSIINAGVETVIYISCNPATLARDAKLLFDAGYIMPSVSGYNMFPQTEHIETLAIFEKRSNS